MPASRPACPGEAETVRELREVPPASSSSDDRAACTLRMRMTQLMITRTEMRVAPRKTSRTVPAGALSIGVEPEVFGDGGVVVVVAA
jgi:hypothetical protein